MDAEFKHLLDGYRETHPNVPLLVDHDVDVVSGAQAGPYNEAVDEGARHDQQSGGRGWSALATETTNEEETIALAYTSGTTSKPKGVTYTHRGVYLAAIANIVESHLNSHVSSADRCHYLWTLPMFVISHGTSLALP